MKSRNRHSFHGHKCDAIPRRLDRSSEVDERESFIAASRHKKGRGSYCQWDHFLWTDYLEREVLSKTFEARHLPLSTGKHKWPNNLVVNPPSWSRPQSTPKTKSKKVVRSSTRSRSSAKAACASTATTHNVMIFDPDVGKLVPVDTKSDSDSSEPQNGCFSFC